MDLLWVAEHGWIKTWSPKQKVEYRKLILLVLRGSASEVQSNGLEVKHGSDSLIGATDVISGDFSNAQVNAMDEGLEAFAFPSHAFDELLSRSNHFSRGLLRQFCTQLNQSEINT